MPAASPKETRARPPPRRPTGTAPFKHDGRGTDEGSTSAELAAAGKNDSELTGGGNTSAPMECNTLRQPERGGGC